MDFPKVLTVLSREFAKRNVDFAIAGGLAIHILGVQRFTSDLDVMTLFSDSEKVDDIMRGLGYETLQRTPGFANYHSSDWEKGRVDVLFAQRKYSTAMLLRARPQEVFGFKVNVLEPTDLVGLKIQAIANDPERAPQDMADIHQLLQLYAKSVDWELIKEYFDLFDPRAEFHKLEAQYR
jgi:predicted nucleotidyltransferase